MKPIHRKLAVLVMAFASSPLMASMVNFEQVYAKDELQGAGNEIISKGFVFSYAPAPGEPYPVGFQYVGRVWRFNPGTTSVNPNSCSATATLTAENGGTFSLYSMDLAELNGDEVVSVTFEGTTASGAHVYQAFQLDGKIGFQNFKFDESFEHLQSVSWLQGDCIENMPHMFDNVAVEADVKH